MSCKLLSTYEAVFDGSEMLDRFGGDRDLMKEIVGIFLDEYPAQLEQIRHAVCAGDPYLLERTAHTLKGAVANFSAHAVTQAAFHLEQLGRHKQLDGAAAAVDRLEDELDALVPALSDIVAGRH